MTKYLKILLFGMAVIGLMAGSAAAATLQNSVGANFGTGNITSASYKIAYEIYSETAGVSSFADRGVIQITLTQNLYLGETANLVIAGSPPNAQFNSAGANYKWILWRDTDSQIIGITPSAGLTTTNLPFSIQDPLGVGPFPAAVAVPGDVLFVRQWNDIDADGSVDPGEVVFGAGIYVNAGLGATCTSLNIIKIDFTTPHETTVAPANFAYLTPEFSVTPPSGSSLTTELNTDDDFRTFVQGTGPDVQNALTILDPNFFAIGDNAVTGVPAADNMWIVYAAVSPAGSFSFKVNSVVGEPDANLVFDVPPPHLCAANSDSTVFSCSEAAVSLVGDHNLVLVVDGVSNNEPTNWTLSQVSITANGLKDLCYNIPDGRNIGVWYGGLEAFVPFVKGTADRSYATYIVLYNRYSADAKVYVTTFKDSGASVIMVATSQITGKEVIPADGKLLITDEDIMAFLAAQGITWNPEDGIPVKFSIRVPSQTGSTTITGSGAIPNIPPSAFAFQGDILHTNPFDPFVEGIVMSTFPGGQRNVPLKFKITFKQGEYGS